jgi:hypothetical protein
VIRIPAVRISKADRFHVKEFFFLDVDAVSYNKQAGVAQVPTQMSAHRKYHMGAHVNQE